MIEEAIRVRLGASTEVTNIIGGGASMRCYPLIAPPTAALPRLVLGVPQGENIVAFDGATSLKRDSIQVVAQAKTRLAAKQLADAVLRQLNGFYGTVALSAGTMKIRGVFHRSENDAEVAPSNATEVPDMYEVIREYSVNYLF